MIFGRVPPFGLLVDLEPNQARLLDRICSGTMIPIADLHAQNALATPPSAANGSRSLAEMNGG